MDTSLENPDFREFTFPESVFCFCSEVLTEPYCCSLCRYSVCLECLKKTTWAKSCAQCRQNEFILDRQATVGYVPDVKMEKYIESKKKAIAQLKKRMKNQHTTVMKRYSKSVPRDFTKPFPVHQNTTSRDFSADCAAARQKSVLGSVLLLACFVASWFLSLGQAAANWLYSLGQPSLEPSSPLGQHSSPLGQPSLEPSSPHGQPSSPLGQPSLEPSSPLGQRSSVRGVCPCQRTRKWRGVLDAIHNGSAEFCEPDCLYRLTRDQHFELHREALLRSDL